MQTTVAVRPASHATVGSTTSNRRSSRSGSWWQRTDPALHPCRLWLTTYRLAGPVTAAPAGNGGREACIAESWCTRLAFQAGSSEERSVSVSVAIQSDKDQVVIAVDPHKASWTAAAVDASLQPLASIQPRRLSGAAPFRAPMAQRRLGDRRGRRCGAPLTRRLRADGIEVIDVPAKLDYGPVDRIRAALMAVVVRFRSTRAQL